MTDHGQGQGCLPLEPERRCIGFGSEKRLKPDKVSRELFALACKRGMKRACVNDCAHSRWGDRTGFGKRFASLRIQFEEARQLTNDPHDLIIHYHFLRRASVQVWMIFSVCGQNIFSLAAANGDSKLVGTVVTLHKIKKVRLLSFFRIQIKLFRFYHSVGSHFWKTGHVNNVQPSLQKGIDRREMNRPRVIHGCETTIDKEFGASNLYLGRPMCSSDCSNGDINRSLVSERPGISTIWRRLCREQQKKKI